MTPKHLPGDRGMALLLVVAVIAVLSVVVIGFNDRTRSFMMQANIYQDGTRLEAMAASGIEIGLAVLHDDGSVDGHDSLLEPWARLDEVDISSLFDQAAVLVEIIDLSGRFPINRLVSQSDGAPFPGSSELFRQTFLRLLNSPEFAVENEEQALVIADSLVDWLDSDDSPMPSGAENSYYLALDNPYPAGNGSLETIDELLQVQGISAEILYGNGEKKGLSEYINIHGNGRININTAPAVVLRSLAPGISDVDMENLEDFRSDERSAALLAEPGWYRGLTGWPSDVVIDPSLISTRSSYFRIRTAAQYGTQRRQAIADVGRLNEQMTVYYRIIQ